MSGGVEERVHVRLLDNLTGVEHGDLFAGFRDDAEVMRNHDDRGIVALTQIVHQIENLRLNGHVQRGGGLIAEQYFRIARQRNGNDHPLPHAAGKLGRPCVIKILKPIRIKKLSQPPDMPGITLPLNLKPERSI